jgi:hypothetical protein
MKSESQAHDHYITNNLQLEVSLHLRSMAPKHNAVLTTALKIPTTQKLTNKRVILASASPRRKEILQTLVRTQDFFNSTSK